jgi:hypothetical protein
MKKLIRNILRGLGLYSAALDVENKVITVFKKAERKEFYAEFIKEGEYFVFPLGYK